jgi:hypothetical protein
VALPAARRRRWPRGWARRCACGRPGAATGGLAWRMRAARFSFFAFVNDLCVEEFIHYDVQKNLVRWICEINPCYEFVDDL